MPKGWLTFNLADVKTTPADILRCVQHALGEHEMCRELQMEASLQSERELVVDYMLEGFKPHEFRTTLPTDCTMQTLYDIYEAMVKHVTDNDAGEGWKL